MVEFMGSAHRLTEVNILPKIDENLSKGYGADTKYYGQTNEWTDEGHPIFVLRRRINKL